jgi:hypothetical protein
VRGAAAPSAHDIAAALRWAVGLGAAVAAPVMVDDEETGAAPYRPAARAAAAPQALTAAQRSELGGLTGGEFPCWISGLPGAKCANCGDYVFVTLSSNYLYDCAALEERISDVAAYRIE